MCHHVQELMIMFEESLGYALISGAIGTMLWIKLDHERWQENQHDGTTFGGLINGIASALVELTSSFKVQTRVPTATEFI